MAKFYGVFSKKDNYLHGAFPPTKNGLKLAKKHLQKITLDNKNKKLFYIKIK